MVWTDEIPAEILRARLMHNFLLYVRWFYKAINGTRFVLAPHHRILADALTRVASGQTRRLIINIPPRYSKTELAVKMFVSWCMANNPRAKFIHLSYSDDLALNNSSDTREIMQHEEYQRLFQTKFKHDSNAKKKWYTEDGGGMYASAAGGAITGFGAGQTSPRVRCGNGCPADGFGGAIIIDDPLKPDDAFSDVERDRVNRRFNNTIASRCNNVETPIIVIMQRLHVDDLSGFLLNGGSGDEWEHVCLSAINLDGTALWPEKHSIEDLERMERADAYTFAGQYRQLPSLPRGNIIKTDWIRTYSNRPDKFDQVIQSWDLAVKDSGDYVAGTVWGKRGADFYLLDLYHEKADFVETLQAIRRMSEQWPESTVKLVEDKANGPAVLSTLRSSISGLVGVIPDGPKDARLMSVSHLFEAGNVLFPAFAPWIKDVSDELTMFPSAKHDDIVDSVSMALRRLLKNNPAEEELQRVNTYIKSHIRAFPNRR